jgi:hypothetical protein
MDYVTLGTKLLHLKSRLEGTQDQVSPPPSLCLAFVPRNDNDVVAPFLLLLTVEDIVGALAERSVHGVHGDYECEHRGDGLHVPHHAVLDQPHDGHPRAIRRRGRLPLLGHLRPAARHLLARQLSALSILRGPVCSLFGC